MISLMHPYVQAWVGITLIAVSIIILIAFWASRNEQFKDQKRANSLPLESGIPEDDEKK